eukprot:Gb_09131 [translate_table: standard]
MERAETLFQESMSKYTIHIQEELASYLIFLSSILKETLSFASMDVRSLEEDFTAGQRRLVDLMHHNAHHSCRSLAVDSNDRKVNDYDGGLFHTISDLSRLVGQGKLEEAFTRVLSLRDINVVWWLCNQMDPMRIFATNPLPVSQLVLLFLMQQLACDLGKEMTQKLIWIQEAATVIEPNDPSLSHYIRPVLEQIYRNLRRQLLQMSPGSTLVNKIRLIMHVVNSLLTSCKP